VNEQAAGIGVLPEGATRLPAPFALLTGGKGGVGKSTLCANLGVELARAGLRVLLVDLDLGLANLNVVLRLAPEHTLEDFLAGRRALADCVATGPAGVAVLPAGSGTWDMGRPDHARRARLLAGLAEVAAGYDLVIGDSAAGIGPDVLAFATVADLVLVATTPDPAALTDAFGLVKALDAWSRAHDREVPTPELVLNLVQGADEADSLAARLRTICERFLSRSPRLAGWLPRSREVAAATRAQRAFVLDGPPDARASLAARSLRRLAGRVEGLVTASSARAGRVLEA